MMTNTPRTFVGTTTFQVDGMSCDHCRRAVTHEVGRIEGVRSVAGLRPEELGRTGVHETDGPVTVADVLAFLPGHQRDHADQLEALLGR